MPDETIREALGEMRGSLAALRADQERHFRVTEEMRAGIAAIREELAEHRGHKAAAGAWRATATTLFVAAVGLLTRFVPLPGGHG